MIALLDLSSSSLVWPSSHIFFSSFFLILWMSLLYPPDPDSPLLGQSPLWSKIKYLTFISVCYPPPTPPTPHLHSPSICCVFCSFHQASGITGKTWHSCLLDVSVINQQQPASHTVRQRERLFLLVPLWWQSMWLKTVMSHSIEKPAGKILKKQTKQKNLNASRLEMRIILLCFP